MTIRAIFYDLDGTLRKSVPAGQSVFADFAASLGVPVTAETRRHVALWEHRYWAKSPEAVADTRAFPDQDLFWLNYSRRQLAELGASPEQVQELAPAVHEHMRSAYRPQDVLFEDLVDTLRELFSRGFTLGVISNRDYPFGDYLAQLGIDQYFDFSLAAGEVNSWKPDKEIFLHALQKVGVQPRETMYVGDNYFADVVGAYAAGMLPVLIDPEGLFDQPRCPVIQSHNQIFSILEQSNLWLGNEK